MFLQISLLIIIIIRLFKVGTTKEGALNGIKIEIFDDAGCSINDSSLFSTLISVDSGMVIQNYTCAQNFHQ